MIELILLKALLTKETYRTYRHHVSFSEELHPILNAIDLWYKNNIEEPKPQDIAVLVETGNLKNKEYLQEALGRLLSLEVPKDISALLTHVKTARIASELALEAFKLSEGNSTVNRVVQLAQQLEEPDEERPEFVTSDLGEILRITTGSRGLRWRLSWLNKSLGSLRRGDFGFVFARPETGKTTFLAAEATNFAEQTDRPILWFNNEEQGVKVKLRCYQAALGATLKQIKDNPDRAQRAYLERTRDLIRIVDDAGMNYRRVEAIVSRENPALVIFDQIDKVKGFKNDREDLALGAIYQWARELAKGCSPVIGVCQASGEAEGEPYLHMGHVSNARTAKQSEADFILGIGKIHQSGHDFIRYFNISKNKLIGDDDTDPEQRHGRQQILIQPEIARYAEV